MEYLLKSDVMAELTMAGYIENAIINIGKLPTFPAPSLAVGGDLISRRDLKDKLTGIFALPPTGVSAWQDARRPYVENLGQQVFDAINSMPSLPPAPSVDDGKPSEPRTNYSLDSTGKMTDLSKPAPLKLEAGKLYRTRGGKKAFIWYVSGWPERYDYAIQGSGITSCNVHGRNFNDDGRDLDLISLWDEPAPESGNSNLLEMIDCGYAYEITNVEKATDSMLSWLKPILCEIARLLAERGA